ncbi:MAG: hypothetical protein OXH52_12175 [Gammaproteobacteria bacterium]|nr:hypothetical protein [Gammaproteobacteria bacterium]
MGDDLLVAQDLDRVLRVQVKTCRAREQRKSYAGQFGYRRNKWPRRVRQNSSASLWCFAIGTGPTSSRSRAATFTRNTSSTMSGAGAATVSPFT